MPIPQGRISLTVMRLLEYQRFLREDQSGARSGTWFGNLWNWL